MQIRFGKVWSGFVGAELCNKSAAGRKVILRIGKTSGLAIRRPVRFELQNFRFQILDFKF